MEKVRDEAGKFGEPHLVGQGLKLYSEGDRELLKLFRQPDNVVKQEAGGKGAEESETEVERLAGRTWQV